MSVENRTWCREKHPQGRKMGREVRGGKEQSRWSEEQKEKLAPSIKQRIFLAMETAEESQNINIVLVLFYT